MHQETNREARHQERPRISPSAFEPAWSGGPNYVPIASEELQTQMSDVLAMLLEAQDPEVRSLCSIRSTETSYNSDVYFIEAKTGQYVVSRLKGWRFRGEEGARFINQLFMLGQEIGNDNEFRFLRFRTQDPSRRPLIIDESGFPFLELDSSRWLCKRFIPKVRYFTGSPGDCEKVGENVGRLHAILMRLSTSANGELEELVKRAKNPKYVGAYRPPSERRMNDAVAAMASSQYANNQRAAFEENWSGLRESVELLSGACRGHELFRSQHLVHGDLTAANVLLGLDSVHFVDAEKIFHGCPPDDLGALALMPILGGLQGQEPSFDLKNALTLLANGYNKQTGKEISLRDLGLSALWFSARMAILNLENAASVENWAGAATFPAWLSFPGLALNSLKEWRIV